MSSMADETSPMRNGNSDTPMMNGDHEKQDMNGDGKAMMASAFLSQNLSETDPANPTNWPLYRKVLTSFQAWSMAATVALGLTSYTAGIKPFSAEFGLNPIPETFIAGFSLYLFGIAFAPIWVPHLTERIGRSIIYIAATIIAALFNMGAGFSHTTGGVLACRFFAGFFGGPTLVLLEGTFADIWSAETTNTYYAVQGTAAYIGAGLGPIVGGYLVTATGTWRWTQWFPAILGAVVLLLSLGIRETYQREIPRRLAASLGKTRKQAIAEQSPALSGVTIAEIARCTVIEPAIMFVTQPVVTLTTIIMFFTFALTFQFFFSVPAALGKAGFSLDQIGLAFLTAIVGSICGAASVILTEQLVLAVHRRKMGTDKEVSMMRSVEYRVIPAFPGIIFMTVALFWIGNTVNPAFSPLVPITGTAIFVWGSAMVTFSIIPYLFDSFQPQGTLSAITSQAVGRLLAAGVLPFAILVDITNVGPVWGLGLFGFISIALWPIPIVLFFFGTKWRQSSKYSMA